MRRLALFPVAHGLDETTVHKALPNAVGHHLREALVLRRRHQRSDAVTGIIGALGEHGGGVLVAEFRERPRGRHRRARGQRGLDERFASAEP